MPRRSPLSPIFDSKKQTGSIEVGNTPATNLSPALLADVNWAAEGSIPGDWTASFANSQVDGDGYYTSGGSATVTKTLPGLVTTGITMIGQVSGWSTGGPLQGATMYGANSSSPGSQNYNELRVRTDVASLVGVAYDDDTDDVVATSSRSGSLAWLVVAFDPDTGTITTAVYDAGGTLHDSDTTVDGTLGPFSGYDELRLDAWNPSGAGTYRWFRTAWYDRPMTQTQWEAVLADWFVV